MKSSIAQVAAGIGCLYADYGVLEEDSFCDFHVELDSPVLWRRWLRPKILFRCDDQTPFEPLPASQAFALLEWGLNWCVTNHYLHRLMVHAAVVEREGAALVLPGAPGSGKSTLCAALVHRSWRLLSDELGLFDIRTGRLCAFPRPISLKNASIDLIRRFEPAAAFGPIAQDTVKGTVGHMRPPQASVDQARQPAAPRWIVFPRYAPASPAQVQELSPAHVFMRLAENSFNYPMHGAQGFDCLTEVADRCPGYAMDYPNLEMALASIEELTRVRELIA